MLELLAWLAVEPADQTLFIDGKVDTDSTKRTWIKLQISSDGPSISSRELRGLFEVFTRIDQRGGAAAAVRRASCRELLLEMGAVLEVFEREGSGAVIEIRIARIADTLL